MKLNEENFGAEALKMDSSKITNEMNTKVLVMTTSTKNSLAVKLYSILKREYSVIMTEYNGSGEHGFPSISLSDPKRLSAFLVFYNIKAVVLTSEMLFDHIRASEAERFIDDIKALISICRQEQVKISYISIANLFLNEADESGFTGINGSDEYTRYNRMTAELLGGCENSLIIEASAYYGTNDYADTGDFPAHVLREVSEGRESSYDDSFPLYPALSDEIGTFLCEHLESSGRFDLRRADIRTTAYGWAKEISGSELILPKHAVVSGDDYEVTQQGQFSDIKSGYLIEQKQKNCVFQMVYKLSPMDYYGEKRVAEIRMELGRRLAECVPAEIVSKADCIVPVPKTGLYYAMGLAEGLKLPYIQALSKDTSNLRSFQVNNADVRKSIIQHKVIPIPELIKGRKLIVVDEAIFTGTTLKVVCKMLRECGAAEIYLAIPTPQCYNQCPYYVQPRRAMLLEYVRESMLEQYFDVDSITYQDSGNFRNVTSGFGDVCMECFFGK